MSLKKVAFSAGFEGRAEELLERLAGRFRDRLAEDAETRRPDTPLGEAHADFFVGRWDAAIEGYGDAAGLYGRSWIARVGFAAACSGWSSDEAAAVALEDAAEAVPGDRADNGRLKADLFAAAGLRWLGEARPDLGGHAFRSALALVPGHDAATFGIREAERF